MAVGAGEKKRERNGELGDCAADMSDLSDAGKECEDAVVLSSDRTSSDRCSGASGRPPSSRLSTQLSTANSALTSASASSRPASDVHCQGDTRQAASSTAERVRG